MLYQMRENDMISNIYDVNFVNKTFEDVTVELKVNNIPRASIQQVGKVTNVIPATEKIKANYFIEIPSSEVKGRKTEIEIEVYINGELMETEKTNFIGPF
jgi:hypothetical protein